MGLFDESGGERERGCLTPALLSRSLSHSLSLLTVIRRPAQLSPFASQACSHSQLHFCWTLLHTHLSVLKQLTLSHLHPFFRILSNFCGAGSDRNVVQLRSSFGEFFDPKSPPSSDGPLSNPRLQVSNSDLFFVASAVLKVKALSDRL